MPKIDSRTYKIMWDTHSTIGIIIGLALFVIFFTGALLLFRGEIRAWEAPALRNAPGNTASLETLTRPVIDSLGQGQGPSYIYIQLPDEHHDNLYMYLQGNVEGGHQDVYVNPTTGQWISGHDEGTLTHLLYHLHFFYQLGPWGLYLAGLISLFALLAITTGTVVHFNRLIKDFFQFRPGKQLRVAWADAHKVLGTIGLPFQVMYVLTGAYFGLVGLIVLMYAPLLFDGDATEYYRKAGYYGPNVTVDSVEAPDGRTSLDRMAARAERGWEDVDLSTMIVHNIGRPDSRVEIVGKKNGAVFAGTGSVAFHGITGEELTRQSPRQAGLLNQVVQSMGTLHFAEFGGLLLTILFFFLTMASSAVILTGNLTWLEARRRQGRKINGVLARLTAGVATGLLPATALLFVTGSSISAVTTHPGWWTSAVFFGSWLATTVYALSRANVARTHRTLLLTGGVLALLIPVANGLSTGDWPYVAWSLQRWAVLAVDLGAVSCGLAAVGIAACLTVEPKRRSVPPRQHDVTTRSHSLDC